MANRRENCCFLCTTEELGIGSPLVNRDLSNFKVVIQYLLNSHGNINYDPLWKSILEEEAPTVEKGWKPQVCDKCYLQMDHVKRLHLELEVIQMKLINYLEKLRAEIIKSSENRKQPLDIFGGASRNDKLRKFQSTVFERSKECIKIPLIYLKAYASNLEVVPLEPEVEEDFGNDFGLEPDPTEGAEETHAQDDSMEESFPDTPKASHVDEKPEVAPALTTKYGKKFQRRPPCPVCGKTFKSPEKMIRHHKLRHMPKEKYRHKCPHCPAKFNAFGKLRSHLIREHGAEKYVCQVCGDQFETLNTLRNHRKVVHEGGFACEFCGHILPTKRRLENHLISHSEERSHVCALCGARFKRNEGLKRHMVVHENERNHVCPQCGKGFNLSKYLEDHMRIHEEARPFVCELCGKGFKATGTLHRHKKSCQANSN